MDLARFEFGLRLKMLQWFTVHEYLGGVVGQITMLLATCMHNCHKLAIVNGVLLFGGIKFLAIIRHWQQSAPFFLQQFYPHRLRLGSTGRLLL